MKSMKEIIEEILKAYFGQMFDPEILMKNPNLRISRATFTQILCNPVNPIYSSARTVREKWTMLHELGYLQAVNQHNSRLVMKRIVEDFYPDLSAELPEEEE